MDPADALIEYSLLTLSQLDHTMRALDGTDNKGRMGANAIVGVSMMGAKAFALEAEQSLWRWLTPEDVIPRMPVPHFNVINGPPDSGER